MAERYWRGSHIARLQFHGEAVGKDGDPLDELFDQSLIKLCDVGLAAIGLVGIGTCIWIKKKM